MLTLIRSFFLKSGYIEIESPLLLSHPNVDAYIDSLKVTRHEISKNPAIKPQVRYLISSPEFYLKTILLDLQKENPPLGIFQIAHCFRSAEIGKFHREEFLMLEYYQLNANEHELMDSFWKLLRQLISTLAKESKLLPTNPVKRTLAQVFQNYAQIDWSKLRQREKNFIDFEHHFQLLMIEKIEKYLGYPYPEFIYQYPPEFAGFSKVFDDRKDKIQYARRFEVYWQGIELANGYYELTDYVDYIKRIQMENQIRRELNKKLITESIPFLKKLKAQGPLIRSSGVAVGLDRLFMLIQQKKRLDD